MQNETIEQLTNRINHLEEKLRRKSRRSSKRNLERLKTHFLVM